MNNTIKLNSDNAGPFNSSQNIVNFTIPRGVWNLRDSYISINSKISTTEFSNATGIGVHPVALRWKDLPEAKIPNISIIRDARMVCDNYGVVEDISRVDQLRTALQKYNKSTTGVDSDNYLAINPFGSKINPKWNHHSIYRDIVKEGRVELENSRNLDLVPIQIRLGDIFDFCNAEEFSTERAGNAHIRLRCNFDKVESYATSQNWGVSAADYITGIEDIDVGTSLTKVITSKVQYSSLDQSPYFLNQKIKIQGNGVSSGAGPPPAALNQNTIITAINWDRTAGSATIGQIILTVADNIGVITADGTYEEVFIDSVAIQASTVTYDFAEIILKEAQDTGSDGIEYNTYSVQQDNGNQVKQYNRVFQIEPECTAVMAIMEGAGNLISNNQDLVSYDLRLNGESLLDNHIVEFNDSLNRDRINMTMGHMDERLRNLIPHIGDTTEDISRYETDALSISGLMNPIVPSGNTQLLQVNVDASNNTTDTGMKEFNLFKQHPRQFSY
mgnify:CR=1 FL=1